MLTWLWNLLHRYDMLMVNVYWLTVAWYHRLADLTAIQYRRLRERWMSTITKLRRIRRRKQRRKLNESELRDRVTEVVEQLVRSKRIKRSVADDYYSRMSDAGFLDLGWDPDIENDGAAFGKPLWRKVPYVNPTKLKNQIVGRMTQVQYAFGKVHKAWTHDQLKVFMRQKQEERDIPPEVKRTKFTVVMKKANRKVA